MPTKPLSKTHTHIMLLTSLIAGVGFFDFVIFLYMADTLGQVLFVDRGAGLLYELQVVGLLIVGCIASPLGGFLIGRYGDISGRKGAFFLSFCVLGVCTLALGLIPTGKQFLVATPLLLLVARFGQSMAFGGQMPTMWVYIYEHLPSRYLGVSFGLIFASCLLSLLFLSAMIYGLENNLTHSQMLSFGWRIPFIVSGVISCFLLFSIYKLEETPKFACLHHDHHSHACTDQHNSDNKPISMHTLEQNQEPDTNSAVSINTKRQLVLFLPALVLSWILASLFVVIAILLPDLIGMGFVLPDNFLSVGGVISVLFMIFGCMFFGFLSDYVNTGKLMMFGGIMLVLQLLLFFGHLKSGGELILIFFAMLGFAGGVITSIPVVLVRLFPMKNRLTNIALTYNLAYALVSSILPFVLGYVTFSLRLAPALYLMLVAMAMIFISFYIYYLSHNQPPSNPAQHP